MGVRSGAAASVRIIILPLDTSNDPSNQCFTKLDRLRTVLDMNLNRAALVTIRERSGLSRTDLANEAGVDLSLVCRIESGKRNATPAVIRKLADALNCPLMALIGPPTEADAA